MAVFGVPLGILWWDRSPSAFLNTRSMLIITEPGAYRKDEGWHGSEKPRVNHRQNGRQVSFSGSNEEQPEVRETEQLSPLQPLAPGWGLSSTQNKQGQLEISLDSAEAARLKCPNSRFSTLVVHCTMPTVPSFGSHWFKSGALQGQPPVFCTYAHCEISVLKRSLEMGKERKKSYVYILLSRANN